MPPATPDDLFALFDRLDIRAVTHRHEPAFTVEQGHRVWGSIPGIHCKNLFLKDGKGRLWLVVAPADRRVDLKALPARIGAARLSFGSAELLVEVLGIEPGSVTPFAVINDPGQRVSVVLDSWMMTQELVNYHPLRNDMTTTLTPAELVRFFEHTGHHPLLVDL
ncbi:putative YbaK/aminoacyl-tRNA synthetase-associated domain [Magnetospirillum sp. XM-1]|uniref:prolyl-tRNA synthetase associated domain-containing protein n=1 Tax=Magnetospirillum sp. XM-1 TaxID=1663591 RepID=UPI00073DBB70|nr:prolyl-tRNA synthetase associated domain-containing protein [Magnetospirillum sp. XM-1]CUW41688.1 putative YbaK/aminoacyl-tRNA synthetase-associated domain [Magnetospirillum sp. XM-1]